MGSAQSCREEMWTYLHWFNEALDQPLLKCLFCLSRGTKIIRLMHLLDVILTNNIFPALIADLYWRLCSDNWGGQIWFLLSSSGHCTGHVFFIFYFFFTLTSRLLFFSWVQLNKLKALEGKSPYFALVGCIILCIWVGIWVRLYDSAHLQFRLLI